MSVLFGIKTAPDDTQTPPPVSWRARRSSFGLLDPAPKPGAGPRGLNGDPTLAAAVGVGPAKPGRGPAAEIFAVLSRQAGERPGQERWQSNRQEGFSQSRLPRWAISFEQGGRFRGGACTLRRARGVVGLYLVRAGAQAKGWGIAAVREQPVSTVSEAERRSDRRQAAGPLPLVRRTAARQVTADPPGGPQGGASSPWLRPAASGRRDRRRSRGEGREYASGDRRVDGGGGGAP